MEHQVHSIVTDEFLMALVPFLAAITAYVKAHMAEQRIKEVLKKCSVENCPLRDRRE